MRHSLIAAAAASCLVATVPTFAQELSMQGALPAQSPETTPEIVNGAPVSAALQRSLGLVTVGGGCSGTLINQSWVLTADHCLTTNGVRGGPATAFANVAITATWSAARAIPTRFVRFFNSDNVDIALVFLGNGDLGPVQNIQFLGVDPVVNGQAIVKYGRGISAYARRDPGPPPRDVAAVSDGYRNASFAASTGSATTYDTVANGAGQVANGGDSGGPDFLFRPGREPAIVGVQSTCHFPAGACLAGHNCQPAPGVVDWNWVTNVDFCSSARVVNVRKRIVETVFCNGVRGCGDSEISQLLLVP